MMTHPLTVVDLTIAEQSEMRVLVQLHGLHPIQAIHDFQTMKTNNRVLQVENTFQPEIAFSSFSTYCFTFVIWKQEQYRVGSKILTIKEWRILNVLKLSNVSPVLTTG
jgi:hypothetical protein